MLWSEDVKIEYYASVTVCNTLTLLQSAHNSAL
jgi:hypothetical protein